MTKRDDKNEIIPGEDGRYHCPYCDYDTQLINKMKQHQSMVHGQQWSKAGDKLVKHTPPAASKTAAAKPDVVLVVAPQEEPVVKEN